MDWQVEELRRALLRSEDTKQKLLEQIEKQDLTIREEKRRQSGSVPPHRIHRHCLDHVNQRLIYNALEC